MKNIMVTGGAGFIGSNLALELESRYPDSNIFVVDDFRVGNFKNLLGFKHDIITADVSSDSFLKIASKIDVDVIFHEAAITDTTIHDQRKMMNDNVEGFRNVLELAIMKKARLVYASSAGTYGSQDTPTKEEDAGKPNNIYGFSKWIMDNIAVKHFKKLNIVGLRYFNVFGPRETYKGHASSMIYQLALQIKSGKTPRIFKMGEQKRDFIYVKDVVEANIKAASCPVSTIVNVGTGNATSFNDLISFINAALGTKAKPEYFDNPYEFYQNFTQADLTKTKKILGWEPKFSTKDGILDYLREL